MGAVWGYGWAILHEDYSNDGFARLTQQVAPPVYIPPGEQPPPPPPPPPIRDVGTITPAFGRRYAEFYTARTPGQIGNVNVIDGQDRVVTWRYLYDYGGEYGRGFCVDPDGVPVSQWSYGELAENPIIVAVPDIMASPHIAGWRAISLRVQASYDAGFQPWGEPDNQLACGLEARVEGEASMRVLRADDSTLLDSAGNHVQSAPPAASLDHYLGIKVAPNPWPPMRLRVDHNVNRILFEAKIIAYVSMGSTTPPIPADDDQSVPSGPPSTVFAGVGSGGILRPPC